MIKAVIATGGKQYLVKEGDILDVELLNSDKGIVDFEALLLINGEKIEIGKPIVKDVSVKAKVVEQIKEDKVVSIRYKAKKRVKKVRGHRQIKSKIQITEIK